MIQSSLHWGPVFHLLGQPAIPGTGQMLLLHGGSNAYCSGLLVLQHVSEALEVGGKKREEVKEGDRGYTEEEEEEEEEAGFHIKSFLILWMRPHRLWWLFCHVRLMFDLLALIFSLNHITIKFEFSVCSNKHKKAN